MIYECFILSFSISLFLFILLIPVFKKKRITQTVRLEGPQTHNVKNGTPLFGGVIFVCTTIIVFAFYVYLYHLNFYDFILICFPLVFYCIIGFLDDALIVKLGKNNGLKVKTRVIFQILGAVCWIIIFNKKYDNTNIQFFNYTVDAGFLYYPLICFVFVSSTNACNLTDGIDGLSAGCFILSILPIVVLSIFNFHFIILLYCIIIIGAVLGYLCFNYNKARVFMGDSGSLALGATFASLFIMSDAEMLIIPSGIIFILETLCVIIQVMYFKLTKGKRLFKMSPLHHHFELSGLSERKIDYLFWMIQIFGVVISIVLIFNYYV